MISQILVQKLDFSALQTGLGRVCSVGLVAALRAALTALNETITNVISDSDNLLYSTEPIVAFLLLRYLH